MDIPICGGGKLTLEDGTLGSFADKNGNIVAILIVSGECWSDDVIRGKSVPLDPDKEAHVEFKTTTTTVPASCDPQQILVSKAAKVCRNQSGQVVTCPPR